MLLDEAAAPLFGRHGKCVLACQGVIYGSYMSHMPVNSDRLQDTNLLNRPTDHMRKRIAKAAFDRDQIEVSVVERAEHTLLPMLTTLTYKDVRLVSRFFFDRKVMKRYLDHSDHLDLFQENTAVFEVLGFRHCERNRSRESKTPLALRRSHLDGQSFL